MKKLLSLCLSFALMISLSGCGSNDNKEKKDVLEKIKESGELRLGTSPDFAPREFYIEENGKTKIVGTDIFLAEAIAEEIGVELKIVPTDFNGVILNVQTGQVDLGISGFAWTQERAKTFQFSDSYSEESSDGWQGIMVRKEDADKYKTLDDIKAANLIVGAQTGSIQYEMSTTITNEKNIKSLGETTNCAMSLSVGDIDAFVITSTQAYAMMESFDNIVLLPEKEFNLDPNDQYDQVCVIFGLGSEYDSLIEVVNKVINDAKESGDLEQWSKDAKALLPFELKEE